MDGLRMTMGKRNVNINSSSDGSLEDGLQMSRSGVDETNDTRTKGMGGGDDDDDDDERKPMMGDTTTTGSSGGVTSGTSTAATTAAAAAAASSILSGGISRTGLLVLILLAVQNCSKTLLMRYVMKDRPEILTSAAVLGSEFLKLSASCVYIIFYEQKTVQSIVQYLRDDYRNTLLLTVPAAAYNLQMSLEYVALANLNAAMFSVLVQTKLLFTATMAALVLRTKLRYIQVISLVLLTVGVMLCNLSGTSSSSSSSSSTTSNADTTTGITATLGIAVSSGFASVYTEKVIKAQRRPAKIVSSSNEYGLAYTQVQLALMSLATMGVWALWKDFDKILAHGLFSKFTPAAFLSIFNSALGGLIVAAVLKYADSVLKGYATAVSVILTGLLSMVLFGTELSAVYFLGIINVVTAVVLYNGKNLDQYVACHSQSGDSSGGASSNNHLTK